MRNKSAKFQFLFPSQTVHKTIGNNSRLTLVQLFVENVNAQALANSPQLRDMLSDLFDRIDLMLQELTLKKVAQVSILISCRDAMNFQKALKV